MATQNSLWQDAKNGWSKVYGKGFKGVGMGALDAGIEFYSRRHEHPDEPMALTAGIAAANMAGWMFLPHLMWLKTGVSMAQELGKTAREVEHAQFEKYASMGQANFGHGFTDSAFTATSRGRGMQAIMQSRLNARSALANEARSLHRF